MNLIYTVKTKQIADKRYIIGYALARESSDGPKGLDEISGPLPKNLFTDDMQPCWYIREDGSLAYDPAPVPPMIQLKKELSNLEDFLAQTDWYIIRKADSGKDPPEEIVANRQRARNRISEIRNQLESLRQEDV